MSATFLVRYGTISEVARFQDEALLSPDRGARVVVRGPRGTEIGSVLESLTSETRENGEETPSDFVILRHSTDEDERQWKELRSEAQRAFDAWRRRIDEWGLNLELVDLEWTLDREKLILYVLNDRGPECTKLALFAAAAGLGVVEVQPIGADGLVAAATAAAGCGCGSGGCER